MANTNIQRQHTSAPTDNKKCTISVWVKRSALSGSAAYGIYGGINAAWNAAGNVQIGFYNDKAYIWFKTAGGDRKKQESTRMFRDVNGWYHFVYRIDTTQSSGDDRIRVYCNGEEVEGWSDITDPTLNEDISFTTNGYTNYIGKFNWTNGTANYFDGLMSHFHLCDGYSYGPEEFAETDSVTGEWKIKTSPSVSYGNNGYFILKDGNSLTDQSGNSNNWSTHNGNFTKTEDCPSNVFATWNVLDGNLGNSTLTYGNNKFNSEDGANKCWARSTLGMTSGKYYFEMKVQTPSNNCSIGISDRPAPNLTDELGQGAYEYCYQSSNGLLFNNSTQTSSYGDSYTTNDIVMCALDLDNNKLYFGKNGTWQNSGDPTSGSTGTGAAYTVTAPSSTNGGAYFFCGADMTSSNNVRLLANFGNGIFADNDPVASAGTNASGIGIFEYNVPAGFTALSTKGLNE